MEIKYFGEGKVFIKSKKENILIDPGREEFEDKNEARIVIFTDKQKNFVKLGEENGKVIISGPGEYEIGGVEINGVNSMYALNVDGIKIVMVDNGETEISERKKEKLEEADVLLISIGPNSIEIAKKSAANYLVPIGYENKEKELKIFLDAFDKENLESIESLKVDKESLPEGVEVVVLKTNK